MLAAVRNVVQGDKVADGGLELSRMRSLASSNSTIRTFENAMRELDRSNNSPVVDPSKSLDQMLKGAARVLEGVATVGERAACGAGNGEHIQGCQDQHRAH